nr:hypothetical protein [Tanacetum cinerariifolium]
MIGDDNHNSNKTETSNSLQPIPLQTSQLPYTVLSIKLPILKNREYDIWAMKMEHYLCHTDYPIWQVIQNGNGLVSVTTDTNSMIKVLPPKTTEEVMARERERKAKTTLLMALPEDHLAKYHKMANEKEITNNVSTAYSVSSPFISKSQKEGSASYTDEVIHSFFANQSSAPQLDCNDLEQINDDDLEEMDLKWQVAMISMRIKKFYKRTGRKLQFDTRDTVGFKKTKVECFNCHKIRHFARDYRAKWNQDSRRRDGGYNANKARDNCRRPASQDDSKALVTIDGEAIDWSGYVEEDTQNFAMMAYSSSNSSFDNELSMDYTKLPEIGMLLCLHSWREVDIEEELLTRLYLSSKKKKDIMLVQVYVHDIIFGSTKKSWCDEFKELMQNSVKTASTPIETQKPLVKDKEADDVDVYLYRSMIAVKRIFRYLKGQLKLGLWYPKVSSFKLEAYSDSDYAGANLDRKSTTGDCQFLGRRLISWQCKKHTIVATSTTEAEYVVAAHCCRQVLWIQNQLLDCSKEFASLKQTALVLKPPPGMNLAALWHQQSSILQQTRSLTSPNMIQKLEDRVDQLEEENRALKEKSFKTTQVDTTAPVENIEKSFKQGRMIADIDENVEEAQAKAYNLDLQHAKKVLSMQDIDEEKPAKVEEVLEVVKVAKLMTEVVSTAQPTTTAAQVPKASAPRRRRGVIIQDLEEIAASIIVHLEDNAVMRYQTLKRKPMRSSGNEEYDDIPQEYELASPKADGSWIMFKKPNVEASVWKDEKGIYGLAKVKSWKLFESCGVHIITLTTTQMFLLVEKKYPWTHFTLQ